MRVNIYSEEMTNRVEIISKEIDSQTFTGLRFYLELPVTVGDQQHQGPFIHRPGDDDSAAVTFWGKCDLRHVLRKALALLDHYYESRGDKMTDEKTVMEPLRDQIGRALFEEPPQNGEPSRDWYVLSEERREPWRKDADRVIALLPKDIPGIET